MDYLYMGSILRFSGHPRPVCIFDILCAPHSLVQVTPQTGIHGLIFFTRLSSSAQLLFRAVGVRQFAAVCSSGYPIRTPIHTALSASLLVAGGLVSSIALVR